MHRTLLPHLPFALTDEQLASLQHAAGSLPLEKRSVFVERFGRYLGLKARLAIARSARQSAAQCLGLGDDDGLW
jgi:hypothetical protein